MLSLPPQIANYMPKKQYMIKLLLPGIIFLIIFSPYSVYISTKKLAIVKLAIHTIFSRIPILYHKFLGSGPSFRSIFRQDGGGRI